MKLGNKSSLEFENCVQKLQKQKQKIKMVLDSLIELANDPDELQNISDIYTQQDFRVIEISKNHLLQTILESTIKNKLRE